MFARIYSRCAAVFAIGFAAGQPFFRGRRWDNRHCHRNLPHATPFTSFISGGRNGRCLQRDVASTKLFARFGTPRTGECAHSNDVLKDPRKYAGQKIRLVGTIASGFEYADILGLQGKGLGILPKCEPRIAGFPGYANAFTFPPSVRTTTRKPHEFLGDLDWGGGFGHMGATWFQFTIIEMYPADMDKADKWHKEECMNFLENHSFDWPIPDLVSMPENDRLRQAFVEFGDRRELPASNRRTSAVQIGLGFFGQGPESR